VIRSSSGFTLVELMVAIMIFTFGLIAMAGTAAEATTTRSMSRPVSITSTRSA